MIDELRKDLAVSQKVRARMSRLVAVRLCVTQSQKEQHKEMEKIVSNNKKSEEVIEYVKRAW